MRNRFLTLLLASGLSALALGAASAQVSSPASGAQPTAASPALPAGTTAGETAPSPSPAATASTPDSVPSQTAEGAAAPVTPPTGTAPAAVAETVAPPPAPDMAVAGSQVVPNAYLVGDDRLAPVEVDAWLLSPRSLIEETPLVAERTSARVTRLIGTDSRTVPPMIELAVAGDTNAEQRAMIAVGLAQATRDAEPVAPEYAAYLQEAVARSGSETLITAFNVAFQTSEIQTAAINGPGAGRGASGPGSLNGGGDSGISGSIGGTSVVATTSPASGSRGGLAAVSDGGGNGGTIIAGTAGVNGTNGTAGQNGSTGATGAAGQNGNTGATGATGPAGPAGTNGSNGSNGCTDPSPTRPGCRPAI